MKLFDEVKDISLQEYASNSEYEEYVAIVLDPDKNEFKTIRGLFRDKKDGYERMAKRGLVCRKILEARVYDWIQKNAKTVFDAYLMLSTAVSKWRGNNVLSDYYIKILNDIEYLNREGKKPGFGEAVELEEVEEEPYINTVTIKAYPYDLITDEENKKHSYIPEQYKKAPLEFEIESEIADSYLKYLKNGVDLNTDEGKIIYNKAINQFLDNMDFYSQLIDTTSVGANSLKDDGTDYAGYIIELGNGIRFPIKTSSIKSRAFTHLRNKDSRIKKSFTSLDNLRGRAATLRKTLADDQLLQSEKEELKAELDSINKEISNKQRAEKILSALPEVKSKIDKIKEENWKLTQTKKDEMSSEEKEKRLDNLRVKKFRILNDAYKYLTDKINTDYKANINYDNPSGRDLNRLYQLYVTEKNQNKKEEISVLIDHLKDIVNDKNYSTDRFAGYSAPKLNKGPGEDKFLSTFDRNRGLLKSRATKKERDLLNKIDLEKKYASYFKRTNPNDTRLDDHLQKLNDIQNKTLDRIEQRDNLNLAGKDRRVVSKNNNFSQSMLDRLGAYNKANLSYNPQIVKKLDNVAQTIANRKDIDKDTLQKAEIEVIKNKNYADRKAARDYFNENPKEFAKELEKAIIKVQNTKDKVEEAFVNDGASALYASIPQGEENKPTIEEEKTQSVLNQNLFDGEELKEDVKQALLEIADKFKASLKLPFEPVDIYFTGSCANYNYNENSDIDLHLVFDFEKAGINAEILSEYLKAAKKVFNDKYNITIKGLPVEVGCENTAEELVSTGVYSLKNDEWVKKPSNADVEMGEVNEPMYNELTLNIEDAIDSNNTESIEGVIKQIGDLRKNSLASEGEFGEGNLVFKKLRNNNFIQRLRDAYYNSMSKELSLESIMNEDSLYSKSSQEIIDGLMNKYENDEELALREIKQKIDDGYKDSKEVMAAKDALEKMVETKNNSLKEEISLFKQRNLKEPNKDYYDQADPSYLHLSKDQARIQDMLEMASYGVPPTATAYYRVDSKIPLWMYQENGKIKKFSVFGIEDEKENSEPLLIIRYKEPVDLATADDNLIPSNNISSSNREEMLDKYEKMNNSRDIQNYFKVRMKYTEPQTMSIDDFKYIMKLPINTVMYNAVLKDAGYEDLDSANIEQSLDLAKGADKVNTNAFNWYKDNNEDLNLDKQSLRTKKALYQKSKLGYPSDLLKKLAQKQLDIDSNPIEKWFDSNKKLLGLDDYKVSMLKPEFKEKLYMLNKNKSIPLKTLKQEIEKYSDKEKYIDSYFNESILTEDNEEKYTIKDNYRLVSSICTQLDIPHDFLGFVDFIIEDSNVKKQINSKYNAFAQHLQNKMNSATGINKYVPEADYTNYYTIYGFPALDTVDEILDENIIYLREKPKNSDTKQRVISYDLDKFLSLLEQEKIKTVDEKMEDREKQEIRDTLLRKNRVNPKKVGKYEELDDEMIVAALDYMQKHIAEYPEVKEFVDNGYNLVELFKQNGYTPYIVHFMKSFDPNVLIRKNNFTGKYMIFVPNYSYGKPNMGTGANLFKRIVNQG